VNREPHRLWGGRFTEPPAEAMRRFHDSFPFDRRLYAHDIRGSIAYARALARVGLLTAEEAERIVAGLEQVREEFEAGTFVPASEDEDIHTAVERRLHELIGEVAGKLHTGRSRNDQVATDTRLYLLEEAIPTVEAGLRELQAALVQQAQAHPQALMPGYTHLQRAQPLLFAHWLLSHFWPLQRDRERLADCRRRTAVLPLGSGALAGTPFPIDREALAQELGFRAVSPNSLDAVADRDYIAEFLFVAALIGVHLSRLAEDLILFSTAEFGFVTLADAYSTGSSLMPQKKNPDSLELTRGKSGRLLGDLVTLLAVLKGTPSGYNKDFQEDKEPLFDAVETLALTLPVVAGAVATMTVHEERMAAALDEAMLATDLADYLVEKGLPFRQAHQIVGQVVREAAEAGLPLSQLPLACYRAIHPAFAADLYRVFDAARSVARRRAVGGTAPETVRAQIRQAEALLVSEMPAPE